MVDDTVKVTWSADNTKFISSIKRNMAMLSQFRRQLIKTQATKPISVFNQSNISQGVKKLFSINAELKKTTGITDALQTSLAKRGGFMSNNSKVAIDATAASAKQMGKDIVKAQKDATAEAQRFKGEYLSIMFAGMALQRFLGGFVSDAFRTFNTITEGTNLANNAVNRLKAAWEFFKFSLVSALQASPMFQSMINMIITIVNWFSALSPKTQSFLGWILLITIAVAGLLMVIGQVALGWIGIGMVFGPILAKVVAFLLKFKSIKTAVMFLKKVFKAFGRLVGKVFKLLFSPLGLLIASVLLLGFVLFKLKQKFGTWGNVFKVMISAIILAIVALVQFSLNSILMLIQQSLGGLKAILQGAKAAAEFLGFTGIAKGIQKGIDAINSFQSMKLDLLTPVAVKLDELGFNPDPVSETKKEENSGNVYNINELSVQTLSGTEIEEDVERKGYYGFGQGI